MEKEIIHEVINEEVIIKKKDHIFSMYKRWGCGDHCNKRAISSIVGKGVVNVT
jgi:hypothetical protein